MPDIVTLSIQIVLALVTVGAWLMNRRESSSKVANLDAITEKVHAERDKLEIDENFAIFQQLQSERAENEKTIKRISTDIRNLQTDLRVSNEAQAAAASREINLMNDLIRYRTAYTELLGRQNKLETKQYLTNEILQQHEAGIESIKRKTGELPTNLPYTPDVLNK
jgi:septal ring factor EnvC (AmiA/AmiB activator)